MSAFYNRIDKLCKEKGIKGGKMCADIGMSKGILTDLKMGRQTSISSNNAIKIASYFGVSLGYLLGEEETLEMAIDETKPKTKEAFEVSENVIYNKIAELCNQKGIKEKHLCDDIGITQGILTKLKMGKQNSLSSNNAQKIASYFGVTVGYLLGEEETVTNISYLQALNKLNELVQDKEFVELYEAYKKLDDKNKKIVRGLIEDLSV